MLHPSGIYIVTGAYGFIGSALVGYLNQLGFQNLILIDDFSKTEKSKNLEGKKYLEKIERKDFEQWSLSSNHSMDGFFHLGARTDTTEFDYQILAELNLEFSQKVWQFCAQDNIPLVYASSAATYGGGELGYDDNEEVIFDLKPLNPYGISKNEFDKWAVQQKQKPPFWAGLKFFNVYGPNEYHKGRMASVIFHAFNQIKDSGKVRLFCSHHPNYTDGGQLRDFIYVKDVIRVCYWLMEQTSDSGLYNLGTGKARSFNDLANAVFKALDTKQHIEYIDTPEDIRDKYQYFTEAKMDKLLKAGYNQEFYSLEDGVRDYVQNYLEQHTYL